jgi:cyclophilin family peptidyl-prolyl cis-trans isomerase/FKBP-type peptidyl-prolyl cis-trans isomerase
MFPILVSIFLVPAGSMLVAQSPPTQPAEGATKSASTDSNAPSLQPQVTISTSMGDFNVELDAEKAPVNVMNFLDYASSGYYNNTIFHRVVKGRMIHGGGYTENLAIKEEGLRDPVLYEAGNGLVHDRGTIGAYRRFDDLNSAQSQFFINTNTNDNLNKLKDGSSYTVFGRVLSGMDVVEKIESVPVGTNPALAAGLSPYVPATPVVIKSLRISKPLDRPRAEAIAKNNADAAADPIGYRVQYWENECKAKAQSTGSGLRFIECKTGNGAFPMPQDTVAISYVATLVNGFEFDSSKTRGEGPLVTKVQETIRGLREGLQKMRESGRMIFVVPPELGFGNEGYAGRVPPGATLFYDVHLESVTTSP